jgi:hypothetical protein
VTLDFAEELMRDAADDRATASIGEAKATADHAADAGAGLDEHNIQTRSSCRHSSHHAGRSCAIDGQVNRPSIAD